MKRQSAFGKDRAYNAFVEIGKKIAESRNNELLRKYVNQLQQRDTANSQQAATVLHHATDGDAALFQPFLPELIEVLKNPIHDSGPRMIFRVFRKIDIPTPMLATVVDLCFKFLNEPHAAVAIKVNAMYVIARYFQQYPDLKKEFKNAAQNNPSKDLPAFKACLRQIEKNAAL